MLGLSFSRIVRLCILLLKGGYDNDIDGSYHSIFRTSILSM